MSHAYHHARSYIAGGAPQLLGFQNCQLLIDPDLSPTETWRCPRWSSTDIGWLEYRSPSADALDATQQFTYEFWFQPCQTRQYMVRGYASRGTSGSSVADQQWYIQGAYDGGNQAHGIEFTVFGSAGAKRTIWRPFWKLENSMRVQSPWSQCVVIYDGRETASTDRARIYINGARMSHDYQDTNVSTGLRSYSTGILKIGRLETAQAVSSQAAIASRLLGSAPAGSSANADGIMGPVRFWSRALATAADGSTPAVLTMLWNNGVPRKFATLAASDSTGCVVAYDWHDAGYADATTNAMNLTQVGLISGSELVFGLRCLATQREFRPLYGAKIGDYYVGATATTLDSPFGNGTSGVFNFAACPHRVVDPVSNRTALRYEVTAHMACRVSAESYMQRNSGDLFGAYALEFQTTGALEQLWHVSSHPTSDDDSYFGLVAATRSSSGMYLGARLRGTTQAGVTPPNGGWIGGTTILTTQIGVWNFSGNATGSGNTMRLNGVNYNAGSSDSFGPTTPTTNWSNHSTNRTFITLAKLYSQNVYQGTARQLMGTIASYSPQLSLADNQAVERILRDVYGV